MLCRGHFRAAYELLCRCCAGVDWLFSVGFALI
jgi:hypothetical protein